MVNGKLLAMMFISGTNNLYNNRASVDELNVFPVPDGDTGTNMSMTANAMAKALNEVQTESVTKVCDIMSFATLRGARGNSGVILSQFFRGISKALKGKESCEAKDVALALVSGSDTAYNAVMNPTEGTILTVAREAAAAAKGAENDITAVLEAAVEKGKQTLDKTPDMLPALKKAGVVDAGGQGWICVLEGALYYLKNGSVVEKVGTAEEKAEQSSSAQQKIDTENIKYMYCTEFIVEKKDSHVNVLSFKKAIENIGDSMLVIDDSDIVKVHIHTNNPGHVLECAIKLGSMINIKIDNMKHQHQSIINQEEKPAQKEELPHKENAFISVCAGEGIAGILKDLGIDCVIEGGQTMNPSTDDFLSAVNNLNADNIFIFPNNKNIILAANQAKDISDKNIIVIPTRSVPECVAAMLTFAEGKAASANEGAMIKAVSKVTTGQVTYAVRDTEIDDKKINKDDILGLCGGKITSVGSSPEDVLVEVLDGICDDDSEFITLYYGEGVTEETAEKIGELIEERYDEVEVSVKYGGQPLYYYIVSVE